MQARPTQYDGVVYASALESRVAKLLTERGIGFEYSKRFFVNNHYREVDFYLDQFVDLVWVEVPTNAVEVKGKLDVRSYLQKRELRGVDVETFIASPEVIEFWESVAFLKSEFREMMLDS